MKTAYDEKGALAEYANNPHSDEPNNERHTEAAPASRLDALPETVSHAELIEGSRKRSPIL